MVWGFAVAGFVAVGVTAAGAVLTIYALIEPSLPTGWQLPVLPTWLGPSVFAASLFASYLMTFVAFHKLRLKTSLEPVTPRNGRLTIDASPDHVTMRGNPTGEQIREVFKAVDWSRNNSQAQEPDSKSESKP
jgi:hypothetical protein